MRSSARVAPAPWPVRPADAVPPTRPVRSVGPERTPRPTDGARATTGREAAEARPRPEEGGGSRGWELTLFRHLNYPGPR